MAWLEEDQIREKFSIQAKAYTSQIQSAVDSAGRKIRRWINATAYSQATALTPPIDADELLRYETVVDAHAFLTMYYLAVAVGNKLSADGFIKQSQSPSSPATTQTITNQYLTPAEMAAKKQEYYTEARDILEPYLIGNVSDVVSQLGALPTQIAVTADW